MFDGEPNVPIANAIGSPGKSVRLSNITKQYGDFVAVNDVSFELGKGEFLTLLGPSGSGKTSTLMMVAGFETPTSGTIVVDGRDVVSLSPQRRDFGVVFQGYALFPHMSVLENVEFPLRMRKCSSGVRRKLALEMLDKVGLSSMVTRRPRELSGGQQQRVALARALVFQPDALLLDEPLGALDKNMRERMQYEIKDLQRTLGVSILFVTHDQEEAMVMSDRIAVMNNGRVIQIGPPMEVYKHPKTAFVAGFLGETNMISCRIEETAGGHVSVRMDNGRAGSVMISRHSATPPAGGTALLSVRPERIAVLDRSDQADFAVSGIVTQHIFVGKHSRMVVEALGTTFVIITGDAEGIEVGREVCIGWMSRDAQLLEA